MMATTITPAELLVLYGKVSAMMVKDDRAPLPPMEAGTYAFSTEPVAEPLTSADAAMARLRAFAPTQGWLGFQSANRVIDDAGLPAMDAETGVLLSAEACNADGESMHIRYDGAGRWLVSTYAPVPGGGNFLADIATHVAHDDSRGRYLRYRRFWRIDPAHGVQPCAACFIGFSDRP